MTITGIPDKNVTTVWPKLLLLLLLCCVLIAPQRARAEAITISSSLSVNFLNGRHDTGSGVDQFHFVPLPLADLDAHYRGVTLHLEALPAFTFSYDGGAAGQESTRLSIVNTTLRKTFAGGTFVGAGETIYNQRTVYPTHEPSRVASQASRVTGARLEAGVIRQLWQATNVEYVFAVNPAMRGAERTTLRTFRTIPDIVFAERAVQVDTSLRFATALGHGTLLYGFRYVNYTARFDLRGNAADGLLNDRNVGLMPLVGYRFHF